MVAVERILPEGYRMTELGPLPEEWRVVKLGEPFAAEVTWVSVYRKEQKHE